MLRSDVSRKNTATTATRSHTRPRDPRRRLGSAVGAVMGGSLPADPAAPLVTQPDCRRSDRRCVEGQDAPAPGVGRRVQLPGGELVARGGGSGQCVVVTVGTW